MINLIAPTAAHEWMVIRMANLERKYMSQCVSSDYCKGWNDAVDSVVRCKECEHGEHGFCYHAAQKYLVVAANHFCGYGKRRSEK